MEFTGGLQFELNTSPEIEPLLRMTVGPLSPTPFRLSSHLRYFCPEQPHPSRRHLLPAVSSPSPSHRPNHHIGQPGAPLLGRCKLTLISHPSLRAACNSQDDWLLIIVLSTFWEGYCRVSSGRVLEFGAGTNELTCSFSRLQDASSRLSLEYD